MERAFGLRAFCKVRELVTARTVYGQTYNVIRDIILRHNLNEKGSFST